MQGVLFFATRRWASLRWRWVGFFAGLLVAWALLFAMQPDVTAPEGWEALGADYWAAICRAAVGDASYAAVLAMWGLMSAAMMAPTAIPAFKAYDDLTHTDAADAAGFWAFVGGYLLAWLGFSVLAAALQVMLAKTGALDFEGRSLLPWLNAALLAAAGLYQFSPLKEACLSKCRAPMMFFMAEWRPGRSGALAMGLRLGAVCVGCCWALMLLGFVGGVMSLAWMGAAMLLMAIEKLPALGRYLTRPLGGFLLLCSLWSLSAAI